MTLVTLAAAEILLGADGPVLGQVRVQYRDAVGPLQRVNGATVRFATQIVVPIVDGTPAVPLQLQPTDGTFYAHLEVQRRGGGNLELDVTIPDVATIDIGDLVQVDPATYQPTASIVDEWDAAATLVTAARDQTVNAAAAAVEDADAASASAEIAASSASSASASAFAASESADAAAGSASTAAAAATTAGTARTAAQTAAADADADRVASETARTGAETARTGAETAQTGAQTARTAAEQARDLALAGQFSGASLGTTDLNTILTPGVYRQSTAANATSALNYPITNATGVLEVVSPVTNGVQAFQFYSVMNGSGQRRGRYTRRFISGSWEAWQFFPTQRVDNPAQPGVGVYTWDDQNNREQALYPANLDLGSADLDVVTLPGIYRQTNASTLAAHYPIAATTGILEVLALGPVTVLQRYCPSAGPGATRVIYERRLAGGVWSAWTVFATQRVDSPGGQPGVGIFTWDDVNATEKALVTTGIDLGSVDLNLVTVPGHYFQNLLTATLTMNYPIAGSRGTLEVIPLAAGRVMQRFTPHNAGYRGIYQRTAASGTAWNAWQFLPVQRVDETAGRAVYTWDDVNNREQQIYGDTGWRDITSLLVAGGTADWVRIRRIGAQVHLAFQNVIPAASASFDIVPALPAGFNFSGMPYVYLPTRPGGSLTQQNVLLKPGTPAVVSLSLSGWASGHGGFSYMTTWPSSDVWPASLPGTAVGSIPA